MKTITSLHDGKSKMWHTTNSYTTNLVINDQYPRKTFQFSGMIQFE